eukprot:COSAG05_NODE_1877_length_3912_cov_18.999738_6_plen_94_part_00
MTLVAESCEFAALSRVESTAVAFPHAINIQSHNPEDRCTVLHHYARETNQTEMLGRWLGGQGSSNPNCYVPIVNKELYTALVSPTVLPILSAA